MKTQKQDSKVIKTPFGKCVIRVKDKNACHFSFGSYNYLMEDYSVEKYQYTVDGHSFNGFLEIFSGLSDYDLDYNNPNLPKESLEKVLKWCRGNYKKLITPELLKGAKIEVLLREIKDIKEDLDERLLKLLREKEAELAELNS